MGSISAFTSRARWARLAAGALAALTLAACDPHVVWNQVGNALFGGNAPSKPQPVASARATGVAASSAPSGASKGSSLTENAKRSKANAELLHEMYKVVFNREPGDRGMFGSYVDTLNQGASLEGVYNGFTHSSDYRDFETQNPGSTPEALRIFSAELAHLEMELTTPTQFDASAAKPLAKPVDVGLDDSAAPDAAQSLEFGQKAKPVAAAAAQRANADPRVLAAQYQARFSGASIYTLKRVLGDEALKVIAAKKDFRDKLGNWYANWVVHMASYHVDFGIPLRNKADEDFHYKWALAATVDQLEWEVLNRVHRLLDAANAARPAPAAPAPAPAKERK